jgi:hypothetical protein
MEMREIHGFNSPTHFDEFCRRIEAAIEAGELTPTPVGERYGSVMFEETWYQDRRGQIWRLVSPEFPFKGIFEPVKKADT